MQKKHQATLQKYLNEIILFLFFRIIRCNYPHQYKNIYICKSDFFSFVVKQIKSEKRKCQILYLVFLCCFSFTVNLLFELKRKKSTTKFINSKQSRGKNPSIALSNVSRIFGWKTKFLIQQILINQYRYQDFRFRFIRFCCLSYSKQASLNLTALSFPFTKLLNKTVR